MNHLSSVYKSKEFQIGALYATFIGLVLSDIIFTPGDALYFSQQRKWREKLVTGQITPKQYWTKDALGYYLYNSGWWVLVFGAVALTGGGFANKLKVGTAIVGAGFVGAILYQNIKKDELIYGNVAENKNIK